MVLEARVIHLAGGLVTGEVLVLGWAASLVVQASFGKLFWRLDLKSFLIYPSSSVIYLVINSFLFNLARVDFVPFLQPIQVAWRDFYCQIPLRESTVCVCFGRMLWHVLREKVVPLAHQPSPYLHPGPRCQLTLKIRNFKSCSWRRGRRGESVKRRQDSVGGRRPGTVQHDPFPGHPLPYFVNPV